MQFALIAIAHKNPHPDACGFKSSVDLAELAFIQRLTDILDGVEERYSPGARFTILTEGEFYKKNADIFDVSLEEIARYESQVQYLADCISDRRIQLVPLQKIIEEDQNFSSQYIQQYAKLHPKDYQIYTDVMQRSITDNQRLQGMTPEEMAKRYRAVHRAKHEGSNGSGVYRYLEETLGPNYIYCSVTKSDREEVLCIDPYTKYTPPYLLPQHGLGVLNGGTPVVKTMPFTEVAMLVQNYKTGYITSADMGGEPFGFVQFGGKK